MTLLAFFQYKYILSISSNPLFTMFSITFYLIYPSFITAFSSKPICMLSIIDKYLLWSRLLVHPYQTSTDIHNNNLHLQKILTHDNKFQTLCEILFCTLLIAHIRKSVIHKLSLLYKRTQIDFNIIQLHLEFSLIWYYNVLYLGLVKIAKHRVAQPSRVELVILLLWNITPTHQSIQLHTSVSF